MRGKQLVILAVAVVVAGAFILLYERHQPTTEERGERGSKVFPALDRDDVTVVEITNNHGAFRLERQGSGWALTAPITSPAEDGAVSSLLGSLEGLERDRTLEPGEVSPADYGLDHPELKVVLETRDGARHTLEIGGETALGGNRAVSLGGGEVILCSGWFTRDLAKGLDEWRSRDVVDVFADQIASFTLETGFDRVHAVRVGEAWQLLEPIADLADRDQLRNVIADLNALRVKEFIDDTAAADPAALGLEPPRYRVTLVRSEGEAPAVLELGATREQDGATEVACRRDGRDLLWVDDRALTGLGKAPVRWRSNTVYPFDTWDVEAVTLADGESALALGRDGGMWTLDDGGEASSTEVLDRLSKLAALKATDFDLVEPSAGARGRAELELAAVEPGGEPQRVVFTFYPPLTPGGRALVRVSARDTVMGVEATDVDEVLSNLDLLLPQPTPEPEAAEEG